MELREIDTCYLVEELIKRKGVEVINVPVEGLSEIAVEEKEYKNTMTTEELNKNYIYDEVKGGPAIILRIIDWLRKGEGDRRWININVRNVVVFLQ